MEWVVERIDWVLARKSRDASNLFRSLMEKLPEIGLYGDQQFFKVEDANVTT